MAQMQRSSTSYLSCSCPHPLDTCIIPSRLRWVLMSRGKHKSAGTACKPLWSHNHPIPYDTPLYEANRRQRYMKLPKISLTTERLAEENHSMILREHCAVLSHGNPTTGSLPSQPTNKPILGNSISPSCHEHVMEEVTMSCSSLAGNYTSDAL